MNEQEFLKVMGDISNTVLKPYIRDQVKEEIEGLRAEINRQIRLEIKWRLQGAIKDLSEP